MFNVTLFIIVKILNQPVHPPKDTWILKVVYIHNRALLSLKIKKFCHFQQHNESRSNANQNSRHIMASTLWSQSCVIWKSPVHRRQDWDGIYQKLSVVGDMVGEHRGCIRLGCLRLGCLLHNVLSILIMYYITEN